MLSSCLFPGSGVRCISPIYVVFRRRCCTGCCTDRWKVLRLEQVLCSAQFIGICYRSIAGYRLSRRKSSCWMHVRQRMDAIARTSCGSSIMRKRCNPQFSAPALAIIDRTSNKRCSLSGTHPTASAPNASCLFYLHLLKPRSGMSISTSQRSADLKPWKCL